MAFKLCSQLLIGKYIFAGGVNEVSVERSVKSLIDTAIIKIPAAAKVASLKNSVAIIGGFVGGVLLKASDDKALPTSIQTSTLWKEGDQVKIMLGYNQDYRQEFIGFIRSVDADIPVQIHCEGYCFQLRKKQFTGAWKSIQLRDLMQQMVEGTDIKLSPFIPDLTLTNLFIPPQNALAGLQKLAHHTHLTAYFLFDVLYIGLQETVSANTVKYRIGWNVPRTKALTYSLDVSRPILIRLVTGKGTKKVRTIVQAGDPSGTTETMNISFIQDPAAIATIGNQLVTNANYTGFKGDLEGLLQPYCNPADTAIIIDQMYNVLGASYFIEGIKIKYSTDGAKRIVQLGRALSAPQFEQLINNNA